MYGINLLLKFSIRMNPSHIRLTLKNEELTCFLLETLELRQCWLKVQINFHWKSCVGHSTA